MTIRVVLALADDVARREFAETIEQDGEIRVTAVARSRGEAAFEAALMQPDVLVLDLALPQHGAVQATRLIAGRQPSLPIALLAASEETVRQHAAALAGAIRLGARGYLVRDSPGEEIRDAVRELAAGGVAVSPAFARDLLRALHRIEAEAPPGARTGLTADELLILGLRGRGWNLAAIGARMNVGRDDVRAALRAALAAFRAVQDEPPDMLGAPAPRRPRPSGPTLDAVAEPPGGG